VKLALGQINSTIGDFVGNGERILAATVRARSEGAEVIVFPELSLCGYPPMDLLDHDAFVEENLTSLRLLQQTLPTGIAVVVGYVDRTQGSAGKSLQNVAAVIYGGEVIFRQAKRLLPTYDVFDEARYFEPARESRIWQFGEYRIGIAICEDIWWETEQVKGTRYPVDPVRNLLDAGANLILAPSASPFHSDKLHIRAALVTSIGRNNSVPVVYVNMVGGNDSLIFDGYSLVTDSSGAIRHLSPGFVEHVAVVDTESLEAGRHGKTNATAGVGPPASPLIPGAEDRFAELERALVLGLRDYLGKTGFRRVHLGLSGGIDSAVVAVIAARAVGPENVKCFLMPSRYSSEGSISDSERLAANLGIDYATLPIMPVYDAMVGVLAGEFAGTETGIAEENIQARARGNLLMAWSNKFGSLTLTTGNKSELAVGYCTLYGDMSGGLAVIGDLLKTEVYALARHFNSTGEVIPEAILTKPPSAELRPDQKDEDSLPPYDILDGILFRYLILNETRAQIVAAGFDEEMVARILHLVGLSEYKRRQAPPVLKVSPRAFGAGRRMPIARRIYESER
jgi:NAD+ synthase (glutamine-hydrolysing)